MANERQADVYWQIFPKDSDIGLCAESSLNQNLFALLLINLT